MCDTFTDFNDPTKGEPLHNIFMEKVTDDTTKEPLHKGILVLFLSSENVGVPLMATLYIPGLNVGLPAWLGTIPNVLNALDASQLSTLSHGHPVDVSFSAKSSPPPSPTSGQSTINNN
jgi:hypothetical protein